MTYAITGASGPLGRATAEHLLRLVDPGQVVLASRQPSALADFAARGADVRRVDFTDPDTFGTAFAGVDRLLIISTDAFGARRLEPQRAAITAAVAAGVRHIVYTSIPEPVPANPAKVVPDHAGTEQALRDSDVAWTALRNNIYAQMQIPVIEQAIASGRLVTNSGDGATAYVDRDDCAAVAAAVLAQDGQDAGRSGGDRHAGRAYDVTGPAAVTAADLAVLASEISGRPVEVVHVDDAALVAGLRDFGVPQEAAEVVASIGAAARGGFLADVSTTVADLTGRAPKAAVDLLRPALSPAR